MPVKSTAKYKKPVTLILTGAVIVAATTVLCVAKASVVKIRKPRSRNKKSVVSKTLSSFSAHQETAQPVHLEKSAVNRILSSTTGLKPQVLQLGLNAYYWAAKHSNVQKKYLTIVDFSIPSKDKRLWVINLNTDQVVYKTLVANGKNSGLYVGKNFSNAPHSLQSSLGVYLTGAKYYGSDGLSMHVHGLQPGINSNAYSRTIEFHGASYVSPQFAKAHGRVGRSWGCFAMNKAVVGKVVDTIKNGSVVFAYANNHSQAFAAVEA